MKQIIVMIAMVLLGIVIAGLIGDFGDSARSMSQNANREVIGITTGAI